MTATDLSSTARALVAEGKGILAADETVATVSKRLQPFSIRSTPATRRAYRELFFTTPGISEFVSGVIMHDETIHQQSSSDVPLTEVLDGQGILAGIKVDAGTRPLAGSPGELITEGLDGLRERLEKYRDIGARFAKWRAAFIIEGRLPTPGCVHANAHALARYAALCQEQSIMPIVEPEVLMNGMHTIDRCEEVTSVVLHAVFSALHEHQVALEGMLLKPNMVLAGKSCPKQPTANEVAAATLRCLRRHAPAAVPGIVFLSGGQDHLAATAHLSLINQMEGPKPWRLSFSYGRALQDEALKTWAGRNENLKAAQSAFHHRARCDSAAALGRYTAAMENETAVA
jgi:fructose-bisphosphate aldolase class I